MNFEKIYYEPETLNFALGKELKEKFFSSTWIPIESHNKIDELRQKENSEFVKLKSNLIIGVRKTHKYVENHKVSDFLVPYTSSGCTAMCMYCYLVCNYNKCSYLRLFVNREQMLEKLIKTANNSPTPLTFEIGSNSDLVLENSITGNLNWTIPEFCKRADGKLTFPTKFDMVDPLLNLNHNKKVIFRMSVNPEKIINRIELGTSSLENRISAINKMCEAGYPCGILIAPVIAIKNWQEEYSCLIDILEAKLSQKTKKQLFIEIILMTYSYIHRAINEQAFPNAINLYDKELMTGRGRGKYCYKPALRLEIEDFLKKQISKKLPDSQIIYFS